MLIVPHIYLFIKINAMETELEQMAINDYKCNGGALRIISGLTYSIVYLAQNKANHKDLLFN